MATLTNNLNWIRVNYDYQNEYLFIDDSDHSPDNMVVVILEGTEDDFWADVQRHCKSWGRNAFMNWNEGNQEEAIDNMRNHGKAYRSMNKDQKKHMDENFKNDMEEFERKYRTVNLYELGIRFCEWYSSNNPKKEG